MMDKFKLEEVLKTIEIVVDTREQMTKRYMQRVVDFGYPNEREKLNFGDYSIRCSELDLTNQCSIERKMDLDELVQCFIEKPANDDLKEFYDEIGVRNRFEYEFWRAKEAGAVIYILVENASIDKILRHDYESRMNPNALMGSLFAWVARYNIRPIFCTSKASGRMIREILYRELKERLNGMD